MLIIPHVFDISLPHQLQMLGTTTLLTFLIILLSVIVLSSVLIYNHFELEPRRMFVSECTYEAVDTENPKIVHRRWFENAKEFVLESSQHSYLPSRSLQTLEDPEDSVEVLKGFSSSLVHDSSASENIEFTLVIPAYNETDRIDPMLAESVAFLNSAFKGDHENPRWEVLIVDDCSKDDTRGKVLDFIRENRLQTHFRFCRLVKNRGKGGAVTHGMKFSRGNLVLFADADGASRTRDCTRLIDAIQKVQKDGLGVAVGSRAHMMNKDVVVKRSFLRNALMHCFHYLLQTVGIDYIGDTQCGFKLFTKDAARQIFTHMHCEGWIFDIEILLICEQLKIPVAEVPVHWHEVAGSKLTLLKDSLFMAIDLMVIRLNYSLGFWKVKSKLA